MLPVIHFLIQDDNSNFAHPLIVFLFLFMSTKLSYLNITSNFKLNVPTFRQSPAVVISLPSHQEESVFVWTINKDNPEMRNENFNEFMDRQLISKEV